MVIVEGFGAEVHGVSSRSLVAGAVTVSLGCTDAAPEAVHCVGRRYDAVMREGRR